MTGSARDILPIDDNAFDAFFSNNLRESIPDPYLRGYVVKEVVRGTINGEKFDFLNDERSLSVILYRLHETGQDEAYKRFKSIADGLLALCGFFPEHLSSYRRHSMGIRWHVARGRDAYNAALYYSNKARIPGSSPTMLSRIGDNFKDISGALFELKQRGNYSLDDLEAEVREEIKKAFYRRRDLPSPGQSVRPLLKLVS
ncbi:MAG TPA: hypothetical protein VJI75_00070 [Candidatus Nanoarchaeia archaeon]|nr:hypothetical protein [Candidatus Nanoarchaeia archaeon]